MPYYEPPQDLRQENSRVQWGDPLPVARLADYRLAEHEALFVSDHLPRSYDARYFGVQDMRRIVEVVVSVCGW